MTVNKAVLTVTANNQTMYQGGTVPTLTDAITGFVNGDTSSVVGGTATLSNDGDLQLFGRQLSDHVLDGSSDGDATTHSTTFRER